MATGNGTVFVLGGLGGSTLYNVNTIIGPPRLIWFNPTHLGIYGPDDLQLAANGEAPGPLANGPLTNGQMEGINLYAPIIAQLRSDGWSVQPVGYDWRLSCRLSMASLVTAIRTCKTPGPFYVVAHSFGGLVARFAYQVLQAGGGPAPWARTVYLGTPHGGSYDAAMTISNFNPSSFYSNVFANACGVVARRITRPLSSLSPLTSRFLQTIASFPSTFECLPNVGPNYAGLDPQATSLWVKKAYDPFNPYVTQSILDNASAVLALLDSYLTKPRPAELCVLGTSFATRNRLVDVTQLDSYHGYGDSTDGDSTVTDNRAVLPGVPTVTLSYDHTGLVAGKEVLANITDWLKNGVPSNETVQPEPIKAFPAPDPLRPQLIPEVPSLPLIQRRGDP
jgi:hypothetical protein